MSEGDTIIALHYGLLDPLDWDTDCLDHLYWQNRLWNTLVEIEHDYRARYFALVSTDESVRALELQAEALVAERKALRDQRAALRSQARAKVDTQPINAQIKALSARIKDLKTALKTHRKAAREALREPLRDLNRERYDRVKRARQQSGLYWGNYNSVCESYDRARARAMRDGVDLRFHRFDGCGRFTNQIQGGMSVQQLFAGDNSQVRVEPVKPEAFCHPFRGTRRRAQRTRITFTVHRHGGAHRTLTCPMVLHRPIPQGARIKLVTVRRRRVGVRHRWSVTFVCAMAAPELPRHDSRAACGVDLGWRKVPGGLRVATYMATDLARPKHVILPPDMMAGFDHVESVHSRLDMTLNDLLSWIKAQPLDPAPEPLAERLAKIRRAPRIGAGKLAMLAITWRDHPDYAPQVRERLEAWRRFDKRLREEMDNLRDKLIRRRREIYRIEAKRLSERYALIGLEDFDLRAIAQRHRADGTENELPDEARHMRHIAAVSELRLWLGHQAQKHRAEIVRVAGKTTMACHLCGHINRPPRREDLIWRCEGCGATWDQDSNAAANILDAVAGEPASAEVMRHDAGR
jgi:ribosomal protein L37AE/L43A